MTNKNYIEICEVCGNDYPTSRVQSRTCGRSCARKLMSKLTFKLFSKNLMPTYVK